MSSPPGYRIDRIDDSTCPFEQPRHARRLKPAEDEPLRAGEGGTACGCCAAADETAIWSNERWRIRSKEGTSIPGTVVLETRDHLDAFANLTPAHLAELGPLLAAIERCLLELGTVARVHVSRWGDGCAHFHMFLYPRPSGRLQLRGTFLAVWELIMPPAERREILEVENFIAARMRAQYLDSA